MKTKVGILTFHYVHNFGAFLQAWALVKKLSSMGHDPLVINYQPLKPNKFKKPSIGRIRFNRFMRSNLPLSPILRTKSEVENYIARNNFDVLICGSDQIWLTERPQKYDPIYFLDIAAQGVKKVAYAPSVGYIESFGENSQAIRNDLLSFDAISSRDGNTMKALQELGINNVTTVLDPTLLVDFTELITKRPIVDKYIVVCGHIIDEEVQYLESICELSGYKLVAIGTKTKAAHYQKKYVNAQEWLNYIAFSELVVTTLFHGVMIALNLRKPFIAIDSSSRSFKLRDILSNLNLEDRLVTPKAISGENDLKSVLNLDFNDTETILEKRITESEKYLIESIGHES